jgi:hypothetical protein
MSPKHRATRLAWAFALAAASGSASAEVITLTFEGLLNLEGVGGFYNGGTGSQGSAGTNYGVGFGPNALAVIDADAGGTGNFANEPSPSTVLFFSTGTAVLNYAPGFTDGFSFYFSTNTLTGVVRVYDGLNATGTLLGSLNLPALGGDCQGDPNGGFCNWSAASLAFTSVARSIDFGGTVNRVAYDNVTFGSATPGGIGVPEPGTLVLMGAALVGVLVARKRA